ncbi:hypothetical protein PG993_005506 [Apiospora rasikravindrae]|uniref:Uncharacterized protein n=1 Tax=Apiospora rasikravindrae TaxID=990691 RepID=A0ABR1TFS7_9PEZI
MAGKKTPKGNPQDEQGKHGSHGRCYDRGRRDKRGRRGQNGSTDDNSAVDISELLLDQMRREMNRRDQEARHNRAMAQNKRKSKEPSQQAQQAHTPRKLPKRSSDGRVNQAHLAKPRRNPARSGQKKPTKPSDKGTRTTQNASSVRDSRHTQEIKQRLQDLYMRAKHARRAYEESARSSDRDAASQDEVAILRELISEGNATGVLANDLDKIPSAHPQETGNGKRLCWVCKIGSHSANMCIQARPDKESKPTKDHQAFWGDYPSGMTFVCPIHPCVPGHGLDECPYLLQFLSNRRLLESLFSWMGPERAGLPPLYTELLDVNELARRLEKPLDKMPLSVGLSWNKWRLYDWWFKERLTYDETPPSLPKEDGRHKNKFPQTAHRGPLRHGNIDSLITHLKAVRDAAQCSKPAALQQIKVEEAEYSKNSTNGPHTCYGFPLATQDTPNAESNIKVEDTDELQMHSRDPTPPSSSEASQGPIGQTTGRCSYRQ